MSILVEEGAVIAFGQAIPPTSHDSDAEFFAKTQWAETVPRPILRAVQAADLERLATLLIESLSGSSRSSRGDNHTPTGIRQSLWSRFDAEESPRTTRLIQIWEAFQPAAPSGPIAARRRNTRKSKVRKNFSDSRSNLPRFVDSLSDWHENCAADAPPSQLETLILFEILRDAGPALPRHLAARIWRLALSTAVADVRVPSHATEARFQKSVLDAELAWQASLLFPMVSGADQIGVAARDFLRSTLVGWTDAEGVPSAEIVDDLPSWLVSLIRAREWGRRFSRPLLGVSEEKRFRLLSMAVAPLCRADGKLAFSNGRQSAAASIWSAVAASILERVRTAPPAIEYLVSIGDAAVKRSQHRAEGNGRSTHRTGRAAYRKTTAPVFQSDVSHLACLRTNWSPQANSFVVSHHRPYPAVELAAHGKVLLSGDWEIDVRVDGRSLPFAGPWSCACWSSDQDADYLELKAQLSDGVQVERQVLLAREDDLLLLADAVIGPSNARIEYASRLPLVPIVAAEPETRTRTCRLSGLVPHARVIPLGLPCERVVGCAGGLGSSAGVLELRQTAVGALFAPLAIEWNPSRHRNSAAWRSLTVAQDGRSVPASAAAGHRLQIGASQWLVYRSLCQTAETRTVLGHHTLYETVIGRFTTGGSVEPLVSIEQSAATTG